MANINLSLTGRELKVQGAYEKPSAGDKETCSVAITMTGVIADCDKQRVTFSSRAKSVTLDYAATMQIPWECLVNAGALYVGVTGYSTDGTEVAHSHKMTYPLEIAKAGDDEGATPSEATKDIIADVKELAADLQAKKDADYWRGAPGADGADGHSPVITATKSGAVTTVKSDGVAIATINDGATGAPGADGADGQDGYSPQATVEQTATGAVITVTDQDGTTTATITNGRDGEVTTAQLNAVSSQLSGEIADNKATITRKMTLVESENIINPAKCKAGFIQANGTVSDGSTSYMYPDYYIPVSEGDVLNSTVQMRFVCAYDSSKAAIADKGSNVGIPTYTVPSGVAFVRPSFSANSTTVGTAAILKNKAAYFTPYFDPYYKAGEGFHDVDCYTQEETDEAISDFGDTFSELKHYESANLLNPANIASGYYYNGSHTQSNDYKNTGKIYGVAGKTLTLQWGSAAASSSTRHIGSMRFIDAYDANGAVIDKKTQVMSYTVPQNADSVIISASGVFLDGNGGQFPYGDIVEGTTLIDHDDWFEPYDVRVIKESSLPQNKTLHVYLPPEIPVGIGRTIELYNDLVCLEASKCHMVWSGGGAIAYKRKVSITGTTAGTKVMTLKIYDDDINLLWSGSTNVIVSANGIASNVKMLPIGDSLTNLKAWLGEVQTLSGGKVTYIGTRGRSDQSIRHEGRSGFDAGEYRNGASYAFDQNYQGNPSVSSSTNPFWDGSKFSLSHYISQQSSYVGTPDAVQLLLGTNGLELDPTDNVANIKSLVDSIRSEYASIPIFVCNTIYRSNQDGYYSTGSDGYTTAMNAWQFQEDVKIMNLQNALANALKGYSKVYIVPLSVCMDRDNDFGQVEVSVNPRLTDVKTHIASESVHPQLAGYLQMADVMYSSYVAHLS